MSINLPKTVTCQTCGARYAPTCLSDINDPMCEPCDLKAQSNFNRLAERIGAAHALRSWASHERN